MAEERTALDDLLDEVKANGYTEEWSGPPDPVELPGTAYMGPKSKVDHPVVSMNDQLMGQPNPKIPKYKVVPPENQQLVIQHETAPLVRMLRGNEWATLARGENGKYWRIVEQEEG